MLIRENSEKKSEGSWRDFMIASLKIAAPVSPLLLRTFLQISPSYIFTLLFELNNHNSYSGMCWTNNAVFCKLV